MIVKNVQKRERMYEYYVLIIDIAINRSKGVKREGGRKDDNILLETVNKF